METLLITKGTMIYHQYNTEKFRLDKKRPLWTSNVPWGEPYATFKCMKDVELPVIRNGMLPEWSVDKVNDLDEFAYMMIPEWNGYVELDIYDDLNTQYDLIILPSAWQNGIFKRIN